MLDGMSDTLPNTVSYEQAGFVTGRTIQENIALAYEFAYDIDKVVRGGNFILKLDLSKAYDIADWRFMLQVLK